MLFQRLNPSAALAIVSYTDVDQFRESERYLRAISMPLAVQDLLERRAELMLPGCTLSLVRTFPRIINGYELGERVVAVIPMNGVKSARINGEPIGDAVVILKGNAQCTVFEAEGRLVAILSTTPDRLGGRELCFDRGYGLFNLPPSELAWLQRQIAGMLEVAAREPEACQLPAIQLSLRQTLLGTVERALLSGEEIISARRAALDRYKGIIDSLDDLILRNPAGNLSREQFADEIGVSVRTIQTAARTLCGRGSHQFNRLRRLWMVRRQLRLGTAGLTVKASALAHGFHHMGEFSQLYDETFGELPSQTLATSRGFYGF